MTELLTAAQMRAAEQAAISAGTVTGLELMERAGRGVVDAVFGEWPELARAPHRAVVLCGPGNNGGDGFVVARLLKQWGWEVEVFVYGDPARLPTDARTNYERWQEIGDVSALLPTLKPSLHSPALVVDALFGTGLTRPVGDLGLILSDLRDNHDAGRGMVVEDEDRLGRVPLCVAVDLPSGLCSDSGRVLKPEGVIRAPGKPEAASATCDLTVTFHRRKLGHVLDDGPAICGKVAVCDIGLRQSGAAQPVTLVDAPPAHRLVKPAGHKFSHGHALILSGGPGRTGAARLAARGALRIGAGLVTLGVPPAAQMEVAGQITALMQTPVADEAALAGVLQDDRINAACLGPGLGMDRARALVPVALRALPRRPLVLDADALTVLAEDGALFDQLHDLCILTPHGGEFARLFPDIAKRLSKEPKSGPACSKVDATRDAARRAGCTVLFKGPDTVIAAPDGRCAVHAAQYERAAPWLATAGAGDVLAGFITGLLARGFAPIQAAEAGAWLHAECARSFGPGLIAEDIPEELPEVFRALGL